MIRTNLLRKLERTHERLDRAQLLCGGGALEPARRALGKARRGALNFNYRVRSHVGRTGIPDPPRGQILAQGLEVVAALEAAESALDCP